MTRHSPFVRKSSGRAQRSPAHRIWRRLASLALALQLSLLLLGPGMADETSNFKTVAGISVYIGLIPAEIVKGHPSSHPEGRMHGGTPGGQHTYHLVVALFDEASGDRIENARVTATVSGLGSVGQTSARLEPMFIADTVTYGAFIDMRTLERFDIALTVKVPDRPEPVRVDFPNEHLP